jgi:hypothetical protein
VSEWKADPKDGTPDGRLIFDLWHDWNFCGCGANEDVLALVRDRLRAINDERTEATPPGDDPLAWLLAYVLDSADLTEHGGSVGYAWLTDKGKEVLAVLERHGDLNDLVEEWQDIGLVEVPARPADD